MTTPDTRKPMVGIAGLNVRVAMRSAGPFMRGVELDMLDFFLSGLDRTRLLAMTVPPDDGSLDTAVPSVYDLRVIGHTEASALARRIRMPRILSELRRQVAEVDLMICRLPSPIGMLAARASRSVGTPYVVSVHGDIYEVARQQAIDRPIPASLLESLRAPWLLWAVRRAVEGSLGSFFVGPALEERYGNVEVDSVIFAHFLHSEKDVRFRIPRSHGSGPHRLLYVGGIGPRKGVLGLIEAVRLLRRRGIDVSLDLVGQGPQLDVVENEVASGLRGVVQVHGWLPHGPRLWSLFENADVAVHPSLAGEGVPKFVIEALVRGLPVVATDVGSTSWLTGADGERGWLVRHPISGEALADAIEEALTDPAGRSDRASNGAAFMQRNDRTNTSRRVSAALFRMLAARQ